MKNNEEILTLFEKYLAQISLPEEPHRLYDPIIYSMSEGGKRIRPALLLLCCDAFGGDVQGALPAAAAIEMFHNFTLLHDESWTMRPYGAASLRSMRAGARMWPYSRAMP